MINLHAHDAEAAGGGDPEAPPSPTAAPRLPRSCPPEATRGQLPDHGQHNVFEGIHMLRLYEGARFGHSNKFI